MEFYYVEKPVFMVPFHKTLTTNRNRISYLVAFSYVYDLSQDFFVKRGHVSWFS